MIKILDQIEEKMKEREGFDTIKILEKEKL